ncbi:MAG TPA: arginine--tRNA ligase [Sediminispirochaeta sp.]|nr:arginine--tRNA ligase [Sediminispirochaeta sp.]
MQAVKREWQKIVYNALRELSQQKGVDPENLELAQVISETPPKPELGDIAFPMFPFARVFRQSPAQIAASLASALTGDERIGQAKVTQAGPYVNVHIDIVALTEEVHNEINERGDGYGENRSMADNRTMIEFSCPNTNKPLHLGHLRNDSIGESVSRILKANGSEVRKVNLINDRGIHICKSMCAYKEFGDHKTPESEGQKSDHFVGDYYVRFDQWSKEDPQAEAKARKMLIDWEAGEPGVNELWKRMNRWAVEGIEETYRRTGVSFDAVYYESETYLAGKEEVLKGLDRGVFYREEDGSVWVDLSEIDLDKKVLLRSDGTSLYLTQDIGTAIRRHADWPFTRMIYVVASEQQYHFKVLFHVLKKLGFQWARKLYHLSYGMVNLPEGKMKSREGTVVDADELFLQLQDMAAEEIRSKDREDHVGDVEQASAAVARAALNYYLLQVSPMKDMVFDPRESISFNGNTGPYLQYMGARISSMLRKYEEQDRSEPRGRFKAELLVVPEERQLIKLLASYPEIVIRAGEQMNPTLITGFLYELSRSFSKYYHDHPILHNEDRDLVVSRLELAKMVLQVLKNAFFLVGIPFLERM